MADKKDTPKDLAVGAAGALAVIAHAPVLIAASAGALAAVAWNAVGRGAQRRAERLFECMRESDEEPETFAARLQERVDANDEAALLAFQSLLAAAVQAISPDVIPALGFIGRRFFRGECRLRVARGCLEVLRELDVVELQALLGFTEDLASVQAPWIYAATGRGARLNASNDWYATVTGDPEGTTVEVRPFAEPRRLFGCLKRAGLGHDPNLMDVASFAEDIEIERDAVVLLRDALRVTTAEKAQP